MKSGQLVYKGLNLIVTIIRMLDGLLKRRFGKINWWTGNFVLSGHFGKLIPLVLGLILLSVLVPPCSLIMASYRQKQRSQSEVDAWICEGCKKSFTDKNSKLLLCEYCDNSYCIECLQLTVSAYNVFKKSSLHWFCSQCEEKVMRNIRTDREIEERCSAFLKRFESRVEALESQICNKVDETKVREIVQSINTDNVQTDNFQSRSVSESVLATVKDCRDSINREANFIMYRVKESPSEDPHERKEHDSKIVQEFLDCISAENVQVSSVNRLGKRDVEKANVKDRPVKVTCGNPEQKREVLRKVSNLKYVEEDSAWNFFKKVSVTHDMTKTERRVNKSKLNEAKLKTANDSESGKYIYKVRGPPWNRRTVRLLAKRDGEEEDT